MQTTGRVNSSSLSGALVYGRPYILSPSLEALQDFDEEVANCDMMKSICAALNRSSEALVAVANFDMNAMKRTSFELTYLLRPAQDLGSILIQQVAMGVFITSPPSVCEIQEEPVDPRDDHVEAAAKAMENLQVMDPSNADQASQPWVEEIISLVRDSLPTRRAPVPGQPSENQNPNPPIGQTHKQDYNAAQTRPQRAANLPAAGTKRQGLWGNGGVQQQPVHAPEPSRKDRRNLGRKRSKENPERRSARRGVSKPGAGRL